VQADDELRLPRLRELRVARPGRDPALEGGVMAVVNAYKIILWCESEEDEPGIAAALDEDRLHEVAASIQYHIDPAKE
jgi:hypothetical protein